MALHRGDAVGLGIVAAVLLLLFAFFAPIVLAMWGVGPLADNLDASYTGCVG